MTDATEMLASTASGGHVAPSWLRIDHPPYDLQALFQAMPQGLLGAPSRGAPQHLIAEHYDHAPPRPVAGPPLPVWAAIDGIERVRVLTYAPDARAGARPIVLAYEAAAAIDFTQPDGHRTVVQDLHIICSHRDAQWVASWPGNLPITILDEHTPAGVAAAAWECVHRRRAQLERYVVAHAPERPGYLLLDGSLVDAPPRKDLVAVVKTVATGWTTDPAYTTLRQGWRSPALLLRGLSRLQTEERHTAYVKLHESDTSHAQDYGLIRIETTDPALLDPLAAFVMKARMLRHPRPGQLAPVQYVEDVLGATAPNAFALDST